MHERDGEREMMKDGGRRKKMEWESIRGTWVKGKRGTWGREGCSGLFWCFLKHRGKNAGYFWVQHWDSLLLSVSLNTAAEGFKEELMNTSEWKHGSQYTVPHLEITQAAKLSSQPWLLLQTLKRQQIIFWGIYKKTKLDCQSGTSRPCLIGWCGFMVSQSWHREEILWTITKEKYQIYVWTSRGDCSSVKGSVNARYNAGINSLREDKPNDIKYRILTGFQVSNWGMCRLEV